MRSYVYFISFFFLLGTQFCSAQVVAADTSRLLFQMMGTDSNDFRLQFINLEKNTAAGHEADIARNYQDIGQHYLNHGQPELALKYFLLGLKHAETSGDKQRLAWANSSVANFYKSRSDRVTALKYNNVAMDIFRSINDTHGIGSIYNSLGDLYEWQADYKNAHLNYFASLNTLRALDKPEVLIWPYYNIGEVYMFQGHYDSALVYFDSCLAVQIQVKNRSAAGWTYNNMAALLIRQKKYDEALSFAQLALHIADSLNEPASQMNANRSLYTIYEAKADYKKALAYFKRLSELSAGAFDEENTKKAVSLQMQHDFEKQQALARREQDRKDARIKSLALGLVLLCLIAVVAFYLQRRGNRLKVALLKEKEASLRQKETMMKEIHHRVKNNLQVTGTLLDLQLAYVTDERARDAISESITRLNAISLIHHQLYSRDHDNAIEFSRFATELHIQLHNLFDSQNRHVTFVNKMPVLLLDIDTAVPLGLILNELLTNSYKHAFGNASGSITLDLDKTGGRYTLTYTDSGKGLPADIDHVKLKSLGMMIIHSLARQIGGSFDYTPGTAIFMVRFRDSAEMKRTA